MSRTTYEREWQQGLGHRQAARMEAFLDQLKLDKATLPLKIIGPAWRPNLDRISELTAIPALTLARKGSLAGALLWQAFNTWAGASTMAAPDAGAVAGAREEQRLKTVTWTEALHAYAARLKEQGEKFPRHRAVPREPDLPRIAAEIGCSEIWLLDPRRPGRLLLNKYIAEIGLAEPRHQLPDPESRTYAALLAFGTNLRAAELQQSARALGLEKGPTDDAAMAKTRWHLREFRRCHQREENDPMGEELGDAFESSVRQSAKNPNFAKSTASTHGTEMRRWFAYARKMRAADELPEDLVDCVGQLMATSNVSLPQLGVAAGLSEAERQVIRRWLARTFPPTPYHAQLVYKIEEFFDLSPGTLVSRIRHHLSTRRRWPSKLFPADLKRSDKLKIRPYLPDNFAELSEAEREEKIDSMLKLIKDSKNSYRKHLSSLVGQNYRLKWVDHVGFVSGAEHACGADQPFPLLTSQWREFEDFMTCDRLPISPITGKEMERKGKWGLESADINRAYVASMFGFAALPTARDGFALSPERASLALLAMPSFTREFSVWYEKRQTAATRSEGSHRNLIARLTAPEVGWFVQQPDLATTIPVIAPSNGASRTIVPSVVVESARQNWEAWCRDVNKAARARVAALSVNPPPRRRDAYVPIKPALKSAAPLEVLTAHSVTLREEIPDRFFAAELWAFHIQKILLWDLLIETRFRRKNISQISLSTEDPVHLRRDGDSFVVAGFSDAFKNRRGRVLRPQGFPTWNDWPVDKRLVPWIELYLDEARPILLDGRESDSFFLTRNAEGTRNVGMTPKNLSALIRSMSARLAYNPITGEGTLGMESFGPQAFRDITVTHILRNGGTIEEAAASIADSVKVTQENYADITATDYFRRVAPFIQSARPDLPAIRRD